MIVVNAFIKKSVDRNGCAAWHRRSRWVQRGHDSPKFLENIVILCFERRFLYLSVDVHRTTKKFLNQDPNNLAQRPQIFPREPLKW